MSIALASVSTALMAQAVQDAPPTAGEALYLGRTPMAAQLRGDDSALPAAAVACVNCHEQGPQLNRAAASYAPRLDARLAQPQPRRGGPALPFDQASFCRLLRTGIDPAHILVRRAMPQFRVSDAECAVLWQFVSQRPPLTPAAP